MRKISTASIITRRLGIAVLGLGALFVPVQASGPSLEGTWTGTGTVVFPSGEKESARCRASFKRQSDNVFGMNAVCATASARVAQTASLNRVSANRFSGEFFNSEFGVGGQIRLSINGNSISASLDGAGASAQFNLSK